jgi:hypothetical protein
MKNQELTEQNEVFEEQLKKVTIIRNKTLVI